MMPVSDAAPVWAKALTGIRRAMQRSRSAFDSTSRGVLMVPPSIWRNHGAAGVASQGRRELEVLGSGASRETTFGGVPMHRRSFVRLLTAAGCAPTPLFELRRGLAKALRAKADGATASLDRTAKQRSRAPLAGTSQNLSGLPALRVVSSYAPAATPGMPGPYPGRVASVSSDRCVDTATGRADDEVVREMMARGMRTLTGASTTSGAWRRFFEPSDVVGIKVNCGGHPFCVSAYEIVAEAVRQLTGIGVPVSQICVYERFQNQLDEVNYAPRLPQGVQIVAAERANRNVDNSGYDPATYLEADLFGEEDTRSNMMRLVSRRLTKIINIPNMKDHGATGVTGCLKHIAYGSFSNVARTARSRSGTARPALSGWTTRERAMPIPMSTSSSANRVTWSTPRRSGSACTIAHEST